MIDLLDRLEVIRKERQTRIRLSVAAFAYEFCDSPRITDSEFDALSLQSNPEVPTGRLDDWWYNEFQPCTGMWVRSHPELDLLEALYNRLSASCFNSRGISDATGCLAATS